MAARMDLMDTLEELIEEGDLTGLKRFVLEQGILLDSVHGEESALALAIRKGELSVARWLINQGVDLNAQNEEGETALIIACKDDNVAAVKLLVEAGASLDLASTYGLTPLMECCSTGHWHVEIARFLVENGANVNAQSIFGTSALMLLSFYKHQEDLIRFLIEKGANPNLQDENGETALFASCKGNSLNIMRLLAESGADLELQDKNGFTVLTCAAKLGSFEMVEALVEFGATLQRTVLIETCKTENGHIVFYLLEIGGVGVDEQDEEGETALMHACVWACRHGDYRVPAALLKAGANIDLQSKKGYTALIKACLEGQEYISRSGLPRVVGFLEKAGARLDLQDNEGYTALSIIQARRREDVEKLLVKNEATRVDSERTIMKAFSCLRRLTNTFLK